MLHTQDFFQRKISGCHDASSCRNWQWQTTMADNNRRKSRKKKEKNLGCNLACVMFSSAPPKRTEDAAPYMCRPSNLLYLVPHHHRIVLSDLLSTHFLIVKRTVVLVGISVEAAKETPTATLEAREADLFAAHPTPIFLFLLVLLVVLLAARFRGHALSRF